MSGVGQKSMDHMGQLSMDFIHTQAERFETHPFPMPISTLAFRELYVREIIKGSGVPGRL